MALTKKQQNKVLATLDQLNHDNDEHWNKDGSPTVSVVADMAALPQLTKADIHDIAPDFKRAPQTPKDDETEKLEDGASVGDVEQEGEGDQSQNEEADAESTAPAGEEQEQTATPPAPPETNAEQDGEQNREPTEVERVEAQLNAARQDLDEVTQYIERARAEQVVRQNRVHRLEIQLSRLSHVHRDTSAATVAGYLQSQQRIRAEQEAQYARMKEEGKIGKPRSQLDKAMARRQGYGHQRMVMPPLFANNGKK